MVSKEESLPDGSASTSRFGVLTSLPVPVVEVRTAVSVSVIVRTSRFREFCTCEFSFAEEKERVSFGTSVKANQIQ